MRSFLRIKITIVAAVLCVAAPAFAQNSDIREGDEYFERGKLKKAAKRYDRAISSDPRGTPPGVYGKRAAIFYLQKRYEDAVAFIQNKGEAAYPGDPQVLEYKSLSLWQVGKKDEAIAVADEVVRKRPTTFSNQLLVGEYYFSREPIRAVAAFEGYLKHRPDALAQDDGRKRLKLGIAYLKVERFDDAQAQFELVAKKFRKNPNLLINANNGLCAAYTGGDKFDRAITTCQKIVENRRNVDRSGSVWFNLGTAYLENNQPRKARQAGLEYIQLRRNQSKGYKLVGDAYFAEQSWAEALRYYKDAEQQAKGDADLAMRMGQTYLRLGQPREAISRLEVAMSTSRDNALLAAELGDAYLHDTVREDDRALGAVLPMLATGKVPEAATEHAALRFIAARAYYNKGELGDARSQFLEAVNLRPKDSKYRAGLVRTINLQAFKYEEQGDTAKARLTLQEAYAFDKSSAMTNQNLAVLSISGGKCQDAHRYLAVVLKSKKDSLVGNRLAARAYLCQDKRNAKKASEHYAAAEKRALALRNNLFRAEIYTEWAPLLVETDLAGAVDKLEQAVQFSGRNPGIADAANRNLALALYRRGWVNMQSNNSAEAVGDFKRATRYPKLLRGTEVLAFEFSLALAYLDAGDAAEAGKLFKKLAKLGKVSSYLKAPYDTIGADFFSAYADYRTSNARSRRSAAEAFGRLATKVKDKRFRALTRTLVASAWEFVAAAEFATGRRSQASSALATAAKYADTSDAKDRIAHNRSVLGKRNEAAFKKYACDPPEAMVNLGIVYHEEGRPEDAYKTWVAAQKCGARYSKLDDWIATKRRFFGYK